MKPEIKQKWVEALRSGEYIQGKCVLYAGKKFCCLGVLCDLHAKETGNKWESKHYLHEYLNSKSALPKQVVEWAGFEQKDLTRVHCNNGQDINLIIKFGSFNNFTKITDINDNSNIGFKGIADLIEKEF